VSSESPNEGPYLGGMLRIAWQWIRERVFSGVVAAGYEDLNPAHVGLFRYPTLDRQRPSELAEQLQITRQSVNDLLGYVEQRGYITREADATDGRARVVRLTATGRELERTIKQQALAAELEVAEQLGPRRFEELRAALEDIRRHVTDDRGPP
jgi:DNA-binding MarR family transcriptional regulator